MLLVQLDKLVLLVLLVRLAQKESVVLRVQLVL
jgi:hypothetical protein